MRAWSYDKASCTNNFIHHSLATVIENKKKKKGKKKTKIKETEKILRGLSIIFSAQLIGAGIWMRLIPSLAGYDRMLRRRQSCVDRPDVATSTLQDSQPQAQRKTTGLLTNFSTS